ncbi:hypothetical protein V3589_28680 [Sinorhizobium fredii]|uniref:hypothetical protein n=1 Tax=Rhizobium fredii TaxID=380 RepID=UPI0030952364
MPETNHDYKCPLQAVDRRLNDLHRQWHQAEEVYFDPEAFRVAIQTAIQTARTVSFILQSNKALIPDFDTWYQSWRDQLGSIPLMRWMVDARNRIEKQGDLETHSWVRAEILASHLDDGPREDVPANLFEGPKHILERVPKNALGDHIFKDGVLRIERRWVENSLPDHELLDAVAIAYGHLSLLVADAHRQMGLPEPTVATERGELSYDRVMAGGRMPCMIGHNENRLLDIWIATGKPLELEVHQVTLDREKAEEASKRYGIEMIANRSDDRDPRRHARNFFEMARRMFLHDGHHIFMVIIFKDGRPIEMREGRLEEHGQKYVFMRRLANDVLRMGGDAVLTIGEVWRAIPDPAFAYRRVVDMPEREEALAATLVLKDGEPLQLSAMIRRSEDKVELEDTIEMEGGFPYALAPVYAVWGRDAPGPGRGPRIGVLRRRKLSWLSSTALS